MKEYLSSNNKNQTSRKRNIAMIKGLDNIHNPHRIGGPAPERRPRIGKNGDQHMLLYIKRPRIEHPFGQNPSHEPPDRQRRHLHRYHGYEQRLCPVAEERVEEGEEAAGDYAKEPHAECPYGERWVVCVGDG